MVFSSPLFLFLFLPLILFATWIAGRKLRNAVLLAGSLLFYAWGEPALVVVMIASIAINHSLVAWIDRARGTGRDRLAVGLSIAINIGILAVFKYSGWLWDSASLLLRELGASTQILGARPHVRLPIGISFFTFHALSAVIDVYRGTVRVRRNLIDFALYIACFPQLIAGPIIRYHDVADQISDRRVTRSGFAYGVERFILGLGKKVLIANVLAVPADAIFALPAADLGAKTAWLGIVCYTLQIYFDFSGYSDMAIGLGRMFGFTYLENFLHPYASRSVTEFWRRWHVSLSSWFRDYLYVPLGGNRRGKGRTYFNLVLVFFLCGLWHGASWTFVGWGLYHGAFLVIERLGLARVLERWPGAVRRAYLLLAVMIGWVFFRADDFARATGYLGAMFAPRAGAAPLHPPALFLDSVALLALLAGVLGCAPWPSIAAAWGRELGARHPLLETWARLGLEFAKLPLLAAVLAAASLEISASASNPFIYFRF
jgi:alginate O-acetyltransferase complex protein AlgI